MHLYDDEDAVQKVLEITGGATVVFDFVGEQGAERMSPRMLRAGGSHYVIGYGGSVDIPTIDIISREINVVGNLVGTYHELAELMTLAGQGHVFMTTTTYPLSRVNQALDDLDAGSITGRSTLVPDS